MLSIEIQKIVGQNPAVQFSFFLIVNNYIAREGDVAKKIKRKEN